MRKKSVDTGRGRQKRVRSDVRSARSRTEVQAGPPGQTPEAAVSGRGPKSLMKTSDLGARGGDPRWSGSGSLAPLAAPKVLHRQNSSTVRPADRKRRIEERIAAASQELASGLTEATAAAEELRRAMEQIASGAEQAASASQETLAVASNTVATFVQARARAESARRRTEALQGLLTEASTQIGA